MNKKHITHAQQVCSLLFSKKKKTVKKKRLSQEKTKTKTKKTRKGDDLEGKKKCGWERNWRCFRSTAEEEMGFELSPAVRREGGTADGTEGRRCKRGNA